jgi:hypothetical protein
MLNDAQYLLDEVIMKLPEIKEIELAMEDQSKWSSMDPTLRREKEQSLMTYTRITQSNNILASETLQFFNFLSENCAKDFVEFKLTERVAQLLNYFSYYLLGPKQLDLKVKNAAKLHWNPKLFLQQISEIYLHFANFQEFVEMVVADQRSFRIKIFEQMVKMVTREMLVSDVNLHFFFNF